MEKNDIDLKQWTKFDLMNLSRVQKGILFQVFKSQKDKVISTKEIANQLKVGIKSINGAMSGFTQKFKGGFDEIIMKTHREKHQSYWKANEEYRLLIDELRSRDKK